MTASRTSANPNDAGNGASVVQRDKALIAELLHVVMEEHCPVVTHLRESALLFASRLLVVDADHDALKIALSDNQAANEAVLASRSMILHSRSSRGHVEFPVSKQVLVDEGGSKLIRCSFPEFVVTRQRREHQRLKPLPTQPLQCIADEDGILSFDAVVVDVSASGLGAMLYDEAIKLTPGTILRGCRIVYSGGTVRGLDIEVLYADPVLMPDGSKACRAGCRFVKMNPAMTELMRQMAADLKPVQLAGEGSGR
jgi:c-di-GMP-binding flagellar brake protein YcgR